MAAFCSCSNKFAGHVAELLFLDPLDQFVADALQRHLARRQLAFALEDRKLVADRNDRRNLVRLQREHCLLDRRVAHVVADRLNQAADARAVDVLRILHRQPGEIVGLATSWRCSCSASRRVADDDQPGLHRFAELRFVGLLHLLVGHLRAGRRPACAGRASARGCRACTAAR